MFNFQLVFNFNDDRIIFAGSTKSTLVELLAQKGKIVPCDYELENVLYQPVNNSNNEQTKK